MNISIRRIPILLILFSSGLLSLPAFAEGDPVAPAEPSVPLTLPQMVERDWSGKVEVLPEERDLDTPDGYRILATPDLGGKVLKRMSKESTVGIKAILTLADGTKFYVSGWSWDRAVDGHIPTWIKPVGDVTLPSTAVTTAATVEPAPAEVRSANRIEEMDPSIRPTDSEQPGKIFVLLIGNGRYSDHNPAQTNLDLPTAESDLRLLTDSFKALQANVETLADADRAEIINAVEAAAEKLNPSDTLIIYYTGHAVQVGGRNYLAPIGVSFVDKDQVRATSVPVDHILNALATHPHRFSAVLLDGSRNNPFNNVDSSTHLSRIIASLRSVAALSPTGLAEMNPSPKTLVATSASPGSVIPASLPSGAANSTYAKALATALTQDAEFRDVLDHAGKLVRDWTSGSQSPWRTSDSSALFFPHLPCRKIAAPDDDARAAGRWLNQDIEQGFPLALARLARSLRNRPSNNPSTAALLYLLSYQAVPVPLQSWGPFKVKNTEFAPGLKASIDGSYIGLLAAKEDSPSLIINRFTGEQVSGVEDTFAPSQDATVASRQTDQLRSGDGQTLSTWSVHRNAWDGGQKDAVPADPRATSPILKKGEIVASYYDEGLERVYLATTETTKSGSGLYFWEYALTPPINSLPAMFRQRHNTLEFAAGTESVLQLAAAPDSSWKLTLERGGKVSLLDKSGATLYERTGGQFDDWLVSDSGASILLLFRDQIEILGLDGKPQWTMPSPWPAEHRGALLAFSPAFHRIFAAHLPQGAKDAEGKIVGIDTTRREILAPERAVEGYPQFAAMSGDGEWFFFYDKSRRLRMWDSASAGTQLDLPSTRVPMPLPIPGNACEADPLALPSFHAVNPPLIGHMPESYNAPLWLPDLAEALAGFRINNDGALEWLPNATQKLRDTAKAMNKQNRDTLAGEWAVWFLENRLSAVPH